jgi:hypothetical protein
LSDTMSHFLYYNNDFSRNGNPENPTDYYYYLSGRFKDGKHIRYGDDGYMNHWDTVNTDFMYSGNPRNKKPAWSEVTAKNTAGDRRGVGSIGPFNLPAGATKEIEIAYVFAQSDTGGNLGSYDKLLNSVDVIRDLYQRKIITSVPSQEFVANKATNLLIYPNPAKDAFYMSLSDPAEKIVSVTITDISGKIVVCNDKLSTTCMNVNTSHLSRGLYIIQTKTVKNSYQQKIILE